MKPRLSIVLAVQGGSSRVPEVLDAIASQAGPDVEVLVAYATEDWRVPSICAGRPVRLVPGAQTALIPELWRDGIRAAESDRVALSIGHCKPGPGWVSALLQADLETFAGVGGALDNEPRADALGWAVYILRYARFSPPFAERETPDLPGDNVVYDRQSLLRHADAFNDGFWEPEIHALLVKEGRRLLLTPSLLSVHVNGYATFSFAEQRLRHGTRFGFERALHMSATRRIAQLTLAPLVPAVFGAKVLREALKRPALRAHLPTALPYLMLFVNAWALGELGGTAKAMLKLARPADAQS